MASWSMTEDAEWKGPLDPEKSGVELSLDEISPILGETQLGYISLLHNKSIHSSLSIRSTQDRCGGCISCGWSALSLSLRSGWAKLKECEASYLCKMHMIGIPTVHLAKPGIQRNGHNDDS